MSDSMNATEKINDPAICAVRLSDGRRMPPELSELLNPVDPSRLHVYRLPAKSDVELHYHDFDEYWAFICGHPKVTLRNPAGVVRELELGPGDLVACVRGIEHTLWADHEVVYYQYSSVRTGGERGGHQHREEA